MEQAWFFISIAIVMGWLAWAVGSPCNRGRSFVLGFFLGLIGVPLAVILKSSDNKRADGRREP